MANITAERAASKSPPLRRRMAKYDNNMVEGDYGKLKRLIKPTLGFKSMNTAYATIKDVEIIRMFRRDSSIRS